MTKIILFILSFGLLVSAYASPNFHDPTCPPGVKEDRIGTYLEVKAIIISANKKSVLIGNQYLTIGDKIMDAKIIGIGKQTVTLKDRHGQFTVHLFRDINKDFITQKSK